MPVIQLNHISKNYQSPVLHDINLHINEAEHVAIVGPSGSGKSTLMNLIGLLDTPSAGTYLLEGTDTARFNDKERARRRNRTIGFIFQNYYLLSEMTVLENVYLPLTYQRLSLQTCRERAAALLDEVGLNGFDAHHPNQLSGGQQQRVAIARALITRPTILLADEPTGALDSQTGQSIMELFKWLHQKHRATLIIVTHNANIAAQCTRQIHLSDGRITHET